MPVIDASQIQAARATHSEAAQQKDRARHNKINVARRHGNSKPPLLREAPQCAQCGTTGGRGHHSKDDVPGRTSGERFGVEGKVCLRCYDSLSYAWRTKAEESFEALDAEPTDDKREKKRAAIARRLRADNGTLPLPEVGPILNPRFTTFDFSGPFLTRWLKGLLRSGRAPFVLMHETRGFNAVTAWEKLTG